MSYFRHFDGMCWPAPSNVLAELAWRLTWVDQEDIAKTDALVAASVISAFQELVRLPERERNKIIRELRKGPSITTKSNRGASRTRTIRGNKAASSRKARPLTYT